MTAPLWIIDEGPFGLLSLTVAGSRRMPPTIWASTRQ